MPESCLKALASLHSVHCRSSGSRLPSSPTTLLEDATYTGKVPAVGSCVPSTSLLALRKARALPAVRPGCQRGAVMQKGPAASLEASLAARATTLLAVSSSSSMTVYSCRWFLGWLGGSCVDAARSPDDKGGAEQMLPSWKSEEPDQEPLWILKTEEQVWSPESSSVPSNSHASQKQRGRQLSFVYDLIYIQHVKHIPHTEHLHMLHVFCSTWVAFSSPSPYLSPHCSPTQLPSRYSGRVVSEGLHIPVLRRVWALWIVKCWVGNDQWMTNWKQNRYYLASALN